MEDIEAKIGYTFQNKEYLTTALTHSSFANESRRRVKSNERLEFLGDAVLSIIVSDYIFKNCPSLPEGELTKMRASLVCERTLQEFSKQLNLGKHLRLSYGEKRSNGDQRPSILADAFEALLGAIYLDGGIEQAREFVFKFILPIIKNPKPRFFKDYKTELQEIVQKNPDEKLKYKLVSATGPDHDKHFVVEVRLNSNIIAKGGGRSKKEAEQQAAKAALELMGY